MGIFTIIDICATRTYSVVADTSGPPTARRPQKLEGSFEQMRYILKWAHVSLANESDAHLEGAGDSLLTQPSQAGVSATPT